MKIVKKADQEESTVLFFYRENIPAEIASAFEELRHLLGLRLGLGEITVSYGFLPATDREMAILTRSMMQIMVAFPISYEAARIMVIKSGKLVGVKLRPHDLRRHSATYASRSGVPIEIISKVILRHANLSTIQRYLGTISDIEAIRWIENIYG